MGRYLSSYSDARLGLPPMLQTLLRMRLSRICDSLCFTSLQVQTAGRVHTKKDLAVSFFYDARLGFEPRLTASKAAVLPLDDRATRGIIVTNNFKYTKVKI